jgi:transposase InsO family protein
VKYAFILAREVAFPVTAMCRVLGVSTSGFYDWKAQPVPKRDERDAALRARVRAAFAASRQTYGSPRVCAELRAEGEVVSEKTVAKLMREEGLAAREKRRFRVTTDSKHDDPIAPNIVEREFETDQKNDTWVTDVTCIWTRTGWLYLAVMLDLFSRRVVGWATSGTNDRLLALDALRDALTKRRPRAGLVHHSDRGSPYASDDYRAELVRFGIVRSMSRKGDCWDNAVAESFFSTLKTELVRDRIYASHDEATTTIGEYIDEFYNTRRRHSYLGYLSPIEFELRCQLEAAAA